MDEKIEEAKKKLAEMMASVVAKPEVPAGDRPKMYKGYDIKFLRDNPDHSDFYLVEEYDKEYGKVGK